MQRISDIMGLYHLDPAHSAVGFTVKHAGLSRVRGTFDSFHGYAVIDADDANNSALMVSITTSSINTMVADRDAHLRSEDFFDVASYPAITYVGTGFQVLDDSRVLVLGDLTIKQVTRPLRMVFTHTGSSTDPFGNQRIGFEAQTAISRKDFGITWNAALESGGWLVGDEIRIEIEASAVKQVQAGQGDEEPLELSEIAAPGQADTEVLHGAPELVGAGSLVAAATAAPAVPVHEHAVAAEEPGARRVAVAGSVHGRGSRPRRALLEEGEVLPARERGPLGWWHRLARH